MLSEIISEIGSTAEKAFFVNIYKRFYPLIKYRALRLTNDPEMVDDVVQDTFVRLLPRFERLRDLDNDRLAGYIVLTVRSAACNALRNKYRALDEILLPDDLASAETPEQILDKNDNRARRICAIQRLPESQRDLLADKYVLEASNSELAANHHTTEANIRQMLSRARRRLCSLLEVLP